MRLTAVILNWFIFCCTSAAFSAEPVKILFFPLDSPSAERNLSWLSEGIAFSISRQLSGPGIKVVDRRERVELIENLDLPPDSNLSHGSMIRVAQEAQADLIVMGGFSGTESNLRIAIRILDVRNLKLSGEITANGPLSAMPQVENELGWLILNNTGMQREMTREDFSRRARKIPNAAYAAFIQSFNVAGRNDQIRLLRKAVEGLKDFPEAHYQLGRLYFQKGDWANALNQLSLSGKEDYSDLEYEFIRGTCFLQQDQPVQAIQSLAYVLSYSRSYRVLNNIGVAYLRKGDPDQALSAFMEARNLARSDITVVVNLTITRHIQGSDAEARGVLEDTVKAHPKYGMLQFLSAVVLKSLGENDKADAAIARAKELNLDTDKLQSQDPRKWCLVHTTWER